MVSSGFVMLFPSHSPSFFGVRAPDTFFSFLFSVYFRFEIPSQIPIGFFVNIPLRARAQSVWLQFGLMYMIIESDDVQANREPELVGKPSRDFQDYLR